MRLRERERAMKKEREREGQRARQRARERNGAGPFHEVEAVLVRPPCHLVHGLGFGAELTFMPV